jgi:spondin N
MFKHLFVATALTVASSVTLAQATAQYSVAITNVTPGQTFTPILVMTHTPDFRLFFLGTTASEALEIMAEGGDTAPLIEAAGNMATEAVTIDGLLGPGKTATATISGRPGSDFISVTAMLIPTNDTFIGLDRIRLPHSGAIQMLAGALDAGTEANTQSCADIPGPRCGGVGYIGAPDENAEGDVHIGSGFHDLGDVDENGAEVLGPVPYDWGNYVARVVVRRMN